MSYKFAIVGLLSVLCSAPAQAQTTEKSTETAAASSELGMLIFADDFERSESQEETDEPGNGWATNSKKRAKNDKQVDLKDGAMHIAMSEKADHSVSVTHEAEFADGTVDVRFRLDAAKDVLGLNFADLKYKEVHAGHLCKATISTKGVLIDDLKTGKMAKDFHSAKKSNTLTDEMKKSVRSKSKRFKAAVATGQWHQLRVTITGDTMTVAINGNEVGSFSSEGIAHPTKRMLRVAVPKKVTIDDLKIYKKK